MARITSNPTPGDLEEAKKACSGGFWYHIGISRHGFKCSQCVSIATALRAREKKVKSDRDRLWCEVALGALKIDQVRDVMVLFGERRPQEELAGFHYFCNKCGYQGEEEKGSIHPGCDYHATKLKGALS